MNNMLDVKKRLSTNDLIDNDEYEEDDYPYDMDGEYKEKRLIEASNWMKISKVFCSVMFASFLINFGLIIIMIIYLSFSYSTTTTYTSWWKFHFFGILSPVTILAGIFVVINVCLSILFYLLNEHFDDDSSSEHQEAIHLKLSYYNKWILLSSILLVCSFVISLIGLYNLYYLSGVITWILGGVLLFGVSGFNIFLVMMMGTYMFRRF